MRSSHFVSFLNALSQEKQIRLNGFATLRIIRKSDQKYFKDSTFIESRYLPDHLVVSIRIAPTIRDYCGLVYEREDGDQPTTTKTTSNLKKAGLKILG